jgi:predicted nucleotidyltransferase component of viral defense system
MENNQIELIRDLSIISFFSVEELVDCLVFKGGNVLPIFYGLKSRSSMDLDFSMEGDQPFGTLEEFEKKLYGSFDQTFKGKGLQIFDFKLDKKPKIDNIFRYLKFTLP